MPSPDLARCEPNILPSAACWYSRTRVSGRSSIGSWGDSWSLRKSYLESGGVGGNQLLALRVVRRPRAAFAQSAPSELLLSLPSYSESEGRGVRCAPSTGRPGQFELQRAVSLQLPRRGGGGDGTHSSSNGQSISLHRSLTSLIFAGSTSNERCSSLVKVGSSSSNAAAPMMDETVSRARSPEASPSAPASPSPPAS
eukprot:scaffold312656_cov32-Tisochrysis_lutea.AAC.4